MTEDQQQQEKERARTQVETSAAMSAHEVGIKSQSRAVNSRKHNPQFYEKYTKSSLEDSEKWSHLTNEYGPWLADDHVLSNRRKVHRLQRELLNKTRAEQSIAGMNPGARLKEKPLLNALAQGVHPTIHEPVSLDMSGQSTIEITDPAYSPPADADERTVMDDVANIATARQAMGVEQAGSEALTTATTENRTVREDETEESGLAGSVGEVFS